GGETDNQDLVGPGFWRGLRFLATSNASVLDHVEVRYAGGGNPAAVIADGATLTIRNSVVRDVSEGGLAKNSAVVTVTGRILGRGASYAFETQTGATVNATNNTIDMTNGVLAGSGAMNLKNNLITGTAVPMVTAAGGTINMQFNDVYADGRLQVQM